MVDLVKIRKRAKQKSGKDNETSATKSSEKRGRAKAKATAAPREKAGSRRPSKPDSSKAIFSTAAVKKSQRPKKREESAETEPVKTERSVEVEPIARPTVPQPVIAETKEEFTVAPEEKKAPSPRVEVSEKPTPEAEERLDKFRETVGSKIVGTKTAASVERENQKELLTFIVADEQYAVSIDQIVEIITPRSVTKVPNSAETTVGIISLRGMIVTLLDIRKLLGHKTAETNLDDARIVVVENGSEIAGFMVDRVSRVIKIDPGVIESHPVVSSTEQSEFVEGVFRYRENLMILLDLERLLSRER